MICSGNDIALLYHYGYIRQSYYQYSNSNLNLSVHLTHTNRVKHLKYNMSHDEFEEVINKTQPHMDLFDRQFTLEYNKTQQDIDKIYFKIKQILTYTFLGGSMAMRNTKGSYHIFGCDVMLDD